MMASMGGRLQSLIQAPCPTIQITETTGQEQQTAKGQGYDAGKCRSRSSKPQASEDGGDHSLPLSGPDMVIFVL